MSSSSTHAPDLFDLARPNPLLRRQLGKLAVQFGCLREEADYLRDLSASFSFWPSASHPIRTGLKGFMSGSGQKLNARPVTLALGKAAMKETLG